ncbi:hypothetical protein AVEN_230962-1 [Araneus ventricosus]|uniref:Uncharacterized protein n=1 Tax=Araneus ventricosus TaxID=182803 RepID=A0A4Y2A534_ARAVE|nr:hypothetical protein AVEN_230962-1 [Araneus ventricosus]
MGRVQDNPRLSAPQIAADLKGDYNIEVTPQTARNVITKTSYNARAANGRVMVWMKPNLQMLTKNLCGTLKHSGEGVMVWVCMSVAGVRNLCFIEEIWIGKLMESSQQFNPANLASLGGYPPTSTTLQLIQQQAAQVEAIHQARLAYQYSKDSTNHFMENAWSQVSDHNNVPNVCQQLQNTNENMLESLRAKMMNNVSRMTSGSTNNIIQNSQVSFQLVYSF